MLKARFHGSLEAIPAVNWDALRPDDNPFLSHAFLSGLEQHGCLTPRNGWRAHHLALYDGDRLRAAAPLYLKANSHGEFVFDWSWASAYERNGLSYYPKLLCAIPYTPVTGPRLLVGNATDSAALRPQLIDSMRAQCDQVGLSSAHTNFAPADDAAVLSAADWLPRYDWQFHWHNRGYRDFADFLGTLKPKKRKNIRQERAHVAAAGVECEVLRGDQLSERDWHALHSFYMSTFDEKGNLPVLTLEFFFHLAQTLPQNMLGVLARRNGKAIAGALCLRSSSTLYGRYWGATENVTGLHFEACYYQGIDYCIANGLQTFEPGAQGEHKLARGFLPTRTDSYHYIADSRFREAIARSLQHEGRALERYRAELDAHSPFAIDP